jgi:hypothetical protein
MEHPFVSFVVSFAVVYLFVVIPQESAFAVVVIPSNPPTLHQRPTILPSAKKPESTSSPASSINREN